MSLDHGIIKRIAERAGTVVRFCRAPACECGSHTLRLRRRGDRLTTRCTSCGHVEVFPRIPTTYQGEG